MKNRHKTPHQNLVLKISQILSSELLDNNPVKSIKEEVVDKM